MARLDHLLEVVGFMGLGPNSASHLLTLRCAIAGPVSTAAACTLCSPSKDELGQWVSHTFQNCVSHMGTD